MNKHKPIRLAMIRCDEHAYFFAAFMTQADSSRLAKHCPFINRVLMDPEDPRRFRVKAVPGFRLAKAWDPDADRAEKFSQTLTHRPDVCHDLKDAVAGVDAAFISNCNLDGSDHLQLARPFLTAGLPVFIDKPFASNYRDAKAIVRLANKHKAALMAASMLSYADGVEHLRKRKAELGQLGLAVLHGSHGWETEGGLEGITHGIAMALAMFGHGVDWVECMGELPREMILMHYPGSGKVLVINMDQKSWPDAFTAQAWGYRARAQPPTKARVTSASIGEAEYLAAGTKLIRHFRQMVRTRKSPVLDEQLLEWVRIAEAAKQSQDTGKRVYLKSLR